MHARLRRLVPALQRPHVILEAKHITQMDPAKLERKQAVALQKQRAKQFIQYQLDASRQQTHAPAHPQFALQQSPDPQMRTQVIRPGPEACAGTQTVRIPDIRAGARTIQSRPQVENRTQIIRFPDPPGKQSSWTPDSDAQRMQSHADAQKTHADAQTAQTPDSASSQIVRTPHTGTQTTWAPDRAGAQTTGTQSTLNRMSAAPAPARPAAGRSAQRPRRGGRTALPWAQ